jgi:exonuclease III
MEQPAQSNSIFISHPSYLPCMKIISWNCNMAFRKKVHLIAHYQPDIVIVQECEQPEKLQLQEWNFKPTDVLWIGNNDNKGLCIFSFSHFTFKVHKKYNPALKLVVPVQVTTNAASFMLYAIWANNPADKDGQYVTQVWKALDYYKRLIRKKATLLIGDFNSNTIWDKPRRQGNHSTVVKKLAHKNIHSVYHSFRKEAQGKESQPTFYLYKNNTKPYHLDYCFVSGDILNNLTHVEIGEYNHWIKHSDHMPLFVSFKN